MRVRTAKRSSAKPLIGFYDKSKRGKTLSALLLARGFVGPHGRIGMIESESGRGEAHFDTRIGDSYVGGFEVIPIWEREGKAPPYSPTRYAQAIDLAEQQKWDALIIDSASHEWEGEGGVLHMAALNQEAGKKGQDVWRVPKIDHERKFMLRLMQTPIPLVIVCMRAKYPMVEVYNAEKKKKEWQRSSELEPKQSEDVLFEMFVHGHFDEHHNFVGTGYTIPELRDIMPSGKPITNATGAALAAWARGEQPQMSEALATVLEVIAKSQTLEQLKAVPDQLAVLRDTMTEREREHVRAALKAKSQQLKEAT